MPEEPELRIRDPSSADTIVGHTERLDRAGPDIGDLANANERRAAARAASPRAASPGAATAWTTAAWTATSGWISAAARITTRSAAASTAGCYRQREKHHCRPVRPPHRLSPL